jgi:hypothetical protein
LSAHFSRIAKGIDVAPLLGQLDAHPELWDRDRGRTWFPTSPHREASDIWVRFRDPAELTTNHSYLEPHESAWYPAAETLPAIRPMATGLLNATESQFLGGILLTRLLPGRCIHPHHDRGSWHATFYDRKVYVCLRGNEGCVNRFEDDEFVMAPGEAWRFDNQVVHTCENRGKTERLSAIFVMRG